MSAIVLPRAVEVYLEAFDVECRVNRSWVEHIANERPRTVRAVAASIALVKDDCRCLFEEVTQAA